MATVWTDRDAVTGKLALKALQYIDISDRTVARAREPGFGVHSWDELAGLLDTEKFRRKSKDRDPITWENYRPILTNWATRATFRGKFKRLVEVGNLAFIELEEHTTFDGSEERVDHTLTAFEFDDAGKIVACEVYFMIS